MDHLWACVRKLEGRTLLTTGEVESFGVAEVGNLSGYTDPVTSCTVAGLYGGRPYE